MGKLIVKELICDAGWNTGEKVALGLLKQHAPTTQSEIKKLEEIIERKLGDEYKSEVQRWKKCYKTGASRRISVYKKRIGILI